MPLYRDLLVEARDTSVYIRLPLVKAEERKANHWTVHQLYHKGGKEHLHKLSCEFCNPTLNDFPHGLDQFSDEHRAWHTAGAPDWTNCSMCVGRKHE